MKYRSIPFVILALFVATAFTIRVSDGDWMKNLAAKLRQYQATHGQETVYVQTDKTIYKPDEHIWYGAFLTDASTLKPSERSNVLYVELHDPKGNIVQKHKLQAIGGTASGSFHIKSTDAGGIYTLVAYTRWMGNAGEDSYFRKEIQVQKVITPRLLLKLDFEKKAYGPGDTVIANLTAADLRNDEARDAAIKVKVNIDGRLFTDFVSKTGSDGKAALKCVLPATLQSSDVLLQAIVSHRGTEESVSRSVPVVLNRIALSFYPEGGHYVEGVPSRIAFEALNEFGKGADITGEIVDDRQQHVCAFSSFHFGMGAFEMTPAKGRKYFARITRPAGIDKLYELPPAKGTGYALKLDKQSANDVTWNIHAPSDGDACLVTRVYGKWQASQTMKLKAGNNVITCDTRGYPAGIAVFTLFDAGGTAHCERLAFVNKEKRLFINIEPDKEMYKPRDRVNVKIRTTNRAGEPVAARMSLAVADEQLLTMADDKQDNILSYMFLSAELRGKIHEPSFYFDPKEPKADAAFDYLMLTHGWRRFTWDDVRHAKDKPLTTPEHINDISGRVVNSKGAGCQSEITLIEAGGQRRVGKLKTFANGRFLFRNIDNSDGLVLLAPYPNEVIIDKETAELSSKTKANNKDAMETTESESIAEMDILGSDEVLASDIAIVEDAMPAFIGSDAFSEKQSLDEVVVVGYGMSEKKTLTGSVVAVRAEAVMNGTVDISQALSGKVAGLEVQAPSIDPGAAASVRIRGISSLSDGTGGILVIVDGVPFDGDLSQADMAEITSIQVLKSASATAIYGSRGANGVVVVTTSRNTQFPHSYKEQFVKPTYNSLVVMPVSNDFYQPQEFYAVAPVEHHRNLQRHDFRTTVYWQGVVTTDNEGNGLVSFLNNDASSAFRITAEGLTAGGLIGRSEKTYASQLPMTLDVKIPNYLGVGDRLKLPVTVRNNTQEKRSCEVSLMLPAGLKASGPDFQTTTVEANSAAMLWFDLVPTGNTGTELLSISLASDDYSDRMTRRIELLSIGYPRSMSFSGTDAVSAVEFRLDAFESGSLKGRFSAHTGILDDLFSGTSAIIQKPYGCFEQVSSSCFPNIFALQFMKEANQGSMELRNRATAYIEEGYKKLAAYESKGGGFEWFGGSPGHETLTAYGLIEFQEMSKVYNGVDKVMIARALEFLMQRRNSDGSFKQNHGKYGFSAAPENVNNAYITFALAETGAPDVELSYRYSLAEAEKSSDMYRLALMANAAQRLGHSSDYTRLTGLFIKQFAAVSDKKDLDKWKIESTVVRSSTKGIETVALWATALIRGNHPDKAAIAKCIDLINTCRSDYGFGSTQATSLCLQALTLYTQSVAKERKIGASELSLSVNKQEACVLSYDQYTRSTVSDTDFADQLKTGINRLEFRYSESSTRVPYSIEISWNASTPASSARCPLQLQTRLASPGVRVNETVRMDITLTNKAAGGQPMSMAVVGIPAGLNLQPWQLKELQEKGAFDFYEIIGNELAIYYRELGPKEVKTIRFDLKADIPGKYKAAASSAYLYYSQEGRHWIDGVEVTVRNEE